MTRRGFHLPLTMDDQWLCGRAGIAACSSGLVVTWLPHAVALTVRRSGPKEAPEGSMALSRQWKNHGHPLCQPKVKYRMPARGKLRLAARQPQSWSDWSLQPPMAWQSIANGWQAMASWDQSGQSGLLLEHYIQLGHIGPKDCDDRSEQVRWIPDEALRLTSA